MLPRRTLWFLLAVGVGFLVVLRTTAADGPPEKPVPAKPPTVKVEKSTLVAAVTAKGVVEAGTTDEVSIKLKAWMGPLAVKKVLVEHGTAVKKGDVLVEFDPEKLDQAIRDARQDRAISELALRQTELELPILEKQLPLDMAAAERDNKIALEDLKRFLDIDKPQSLQSAEFQLKSSAFSLEYAKDELKQLQKMYKDKDLTEETEEMVLKRQKYSVEMAEFSFKRSKLTTEQTVKIDLPRREQTARDTAAKSDLSFSKTKDSLPLSLAQKKLSFSKLKYEEVKAKDKLADLEADRAALTVIAPADGLVYYGKAVRAQWSGGTTLAPGGIVQTGEVFLTVVGTASLFVRAEVDEKDLRGLKAGLAGKATATAFPETPLAAKVTRVAAAPLGGKYEVRLELAGDPAAMGVVPGMTCSVRLVTAQRKDALSLPASAIFSDDTDEPSNFIYLSGKADMLGKRAVKIGKAFGDRVEILEGAKLGDEVLASKP